MKTFKRRKQLKEELHIEGAEFLGNAFGFDFYKISTWNAAQQFTGKTREEEVKPAGEIWTNSEDVFNAHIGRNNLYLYFFVTENTNSVLAACINNINGDEQVIKFADKDYVISKVNYCLQMSGSSAKIPSNITLPLFLLPDLRYKGKDGLILSNDERTIYGNYKGLLNPASLPELVKVPETVRTINSYAFKDYPVGNVLVDTNVIQVRSHAFDDYNGIIDIGFENPEDALNRQSWASDWCNIDDPTRIRWGYHLSDEEKARRAEAARLEAERLAAERRAAEEAARKREETKNMPVEQALRFKEQGGNIIILGCRKTREQLIIPEQINGKPVTEVAAFAFYENEDLKEVELPKTINTIGKAAFYGCMNARIKYPKTAKVFTDAFVGVYRNTAY